MDVAIGLVSVIVALVGLVFAYPTFAQWRRGHGDVPLQEPESTATASPVLERVLRDKLLVVGCIPFPPLMELRSKGGTEKAVGYYADVLNRVAQSAGLRIEYRHIRNKVSLQRLKSGEVDIVACLIETAERNREADFAGRVFKLDIQVARLVDRVDLPPAVKLDTEDGWSAVVVEGEIGEYIAHTHYKLSEDTRSLRTIDTDRVCEVFDSVLSSHADFAITDGLTCHEYRDDYPANAARLEFESTGLRLACGLMIKSGENEFREWLDARVKEVRKDPQMTSLESQIRIRTDGSLSTNTMREP